MSDELMLGRQVEQGEYDPVAVATQFWRDARARLELG